MSRVTKFAVLSLVGKSFEYAKNYSKDFCTIRVASEDGKPRVLMRDYQLGRITVDLENGVVVRARIG